MKIIVILTSVFFFSSFAEIEKVNQINQIEMPKLIKEESPDSS